MARAAGPGGSWGGRLRYHRRARRPPPKGRCHEWARRPPPKGRYHERARRPPPKGRYHERAGRPPPKGRCHEWARRPPPKGRYHERAGRPPPKGRCHERARRPPPRRRHHRRAELRIRDGQGVFSQANCDGDFPIAGQPDGSTRPFPHPQHPCAPSGLAEGRPVRTTGTRACPAAISSQVFREAAEVIVILPQHREHSFCNFRADAGGP